MLAVLKIGLLQWQIVLGIFQSGFISLLFGWLYKTGNTVQYLFYYIFLQYLFYYIFLEKNVYITSDTGWVCVYILC